MHSRTSDTTVESAHALARETLADLPDRLRHSEAVAARAGAVSSTTDAADRTVLVAAAYLHDIGYAQVALDTGFHPLDGARFALRHGWPLRIAALIAHHSGADLTARALGLAVALNEFPDERSAVTDALLYADQSTGPQGETLPAPMRIERSLLRHGCGSANSRVAVERTAFLLDAVARVEARLDVSRRPCPDGPCGPQTTGP